MRNRFRPVYKKLVIRSLWAFLQWLMNVSRMKRNEKEADPLVCVCETHDRETAKKCK